MGLCVIPSDLHIPFLNVRYITYGLSALLLVVTVLLLLFRGLNFGIDFAGGTLVQIQTADVPATGAVRMALEQKGLSGFSVQEFGANNEFLIRLPGALEDQESAVPELVSRLQDALQQPVELRRVEFVGPQIGAELRQQGLLALLFALGAIMLYVSLRFEFRFGVGALVALFHDVVLTVGYFSLVQKEINLPVLAALLTVIGYSLNDTIVVYDRIRENLGRYRKKGLLDVLNISLNETLQRTLMTSLTTLVVLAALLIWGGEVIEPFAFTLLFGVLVGTYSSIFVAAPVVLWLKDFTFFQEDDTVETDKNKEPQS
jgi:preprotein translocase subunit SecF